MKCPQCGRELNDGDTFCPGCGWRNVPNGNTGNGGSSGNQENHEPQNENVNKPNQKPSLGRAVRAVAAVVLFVCLMFGCQTCVMSGYMTSLLAGEGVPVNMTEEWLTQTMEKLMNAVNEKMALILLIANLLTVLIICLLFRMRGKEPLREMSVYSVNPFRMLTFAVFGTALNIFVSITLSFIPLPDSILEAFESQYSSLYGGNVLLEIFSVAVVAGITEELIFRGIAMSRLKPAIGTAGAVVVSALIFGLAHGTPVAIAYASLLGVLFSLLYMAFDSAVPGMVCHVFFNLTSYWLALVPGDNAVLMLGLYALSIAAIGWCSYRTFVRRPTFNDMVADRKQRIKLINEEERRIIARIREIQESGEVDINEVARLEELWLENRREYKKGKKKR